MKRQVSTGYVFTPASAKLDLSGVPGLTKGGLLAVLDVTTGGIVYAVASPGLGASFAGLVLTLAAPMTGLASSDTLAILFDDGAVAAQDGSVQALSTGLGLPADIAATSDTGSFGLIALVKRALGYLASLAGTVASGALTVAPQGNSPNLSQAGTIAAAGAAGGVVIPVGPLASLGLQLGGTWTGTVVFFASQDGGATYPIALTPRVPSGPPVTSVTAKGNFFINCGSIDHVLVMASSLASGSVVVAAVGTNALRDARVYNSAADPLTTADLNGAAFGTAAAMTAGTSYAAGRSVGVVCTTAGSLVLSLAGGGTITLPIAPGWQSYPFAATGFAFSGAAAGTVYNLS